MSRCVVYQSGGFTNYGINYRKCSQEELAEMENRAMTENEAIEELKYDCNELGKTIPCDTSWGKSFENAYAMAINALEEVQQYRILEKHLSDMFGGSLSLKMCVDELERILTDPDSPHPMNAKILTYQEAADWEAYRAIGTPEECRAAVKQKAKKPVTYKGTNRAECPICGATVRGIRGISKPFGDWCSNCGQKFDWSDEV